MLALTTALAALIALVGITSRQAPPPTVAQFAPQAAQQIKQAPNQQGSEFGEGGEGEGGGPSGDPPPTATTTTPPKGDPVSRRCVGNPPRQIEDTQSPPCVAFWQGDNGGATWKGVTATDIRIAVPQTPRADPGREVQALQDFFNERFEFYGRKLTLFNPQVSNSDAPASQRNDAASVDSQNAFASAGYSYNMYYAEELARRKIISATAEPYYSEGDLASLAPYVWQYDMALDKQFASTGAWACKRLAGRNAFHAGAEQYRRTKRVFGVVSYNTFPERPVDLGPMMDRLEGCNAKPVIVMDKATVGNAIDPCEAQNTAFQLQQANVSTVLCTCNYVQLSTLMRGASAQAYFPEWAVGTYFFNDSDYALHSFNADPLQMEHMFGLTFKPRELRPENTPATWAVKEGSGRPDSPSSQTASNMWFRRNLYHELLIVASGIQMAGPTLTPETFRLGLQKARFPNPFHPSRQGDVSFIGDHSMTEDAAEFYWSNQAQSPHAEYSNQGGLCYVENGTRRRVNDWPAADPPFGQFPCDSRDQ